MIDILILSHQNDTESDDESTDQSNEDSSSSEQQSTSNSSSQNAKQIDIHNITDRATLEAVINSNNYSEIDKIAAYNSAVANGVIPQGNVMEGPASEAYASSLRVESGQEKPVYDQSNQSSEEENIDDPNAEINAATNEDEYVDALRKNITAVYLLERFKLSMQLNKVIMMVMMLKKFIKQYNNENKI